MPLLVGTFYLPGRWAPWVACILFSAAGVTDWLDGHFARRWQQQTDFGRFLDPIADKLVVAAALFMLVAKDRISELSDLPALVITIAVTHLVLLAWETRYVSLSLAAPGLKPGRTNK